MSPAQELSQIHASIAELRWAVLMAGAAVTITGIFAVGTVYLLRDIRRVAYLTYTEAKVARAQTGVTTRAMEKGTATIKEEIAAGVTTLAALSKPDSTLAGVTPPPLPPLPVPSPAR